MRQAILVLLALFAMPTLALAKAGPHQHPADPGPPVRTAEPAPIRSNFAAESELVPYGSHKDRDGAPDTVGAFRFICTPAHIAADDPIVYPGRPGASHLHQFFGNDSLNANSTFETLRTTGNSTCMSPLNRSGYWQPAMLNADGRVVRPNYWQIYYKRSPRDSPDCAAAPKGCVGIPRGLKMVFGYDMLTNKPSAQAVYLCIRNGRDLVGKAGMDIPSALALCAPGDQLEVRLPAPECWDGKAVDSPNHRDHVAYRYRDVASGRVLCDAAHPYITPAFTLSAFWSIEPGDRPATWRLSSDAMVPGARPGSTFHADFLSAWDDDVEATWVANCIDRMLNCSGGDLGNGQALRQRADFTWKAEPHVVDAPP